jgi:hypothetical protein
MESGNCWGWPFLHGSSLEVWFQVIRVTSVKQHSQPWAAPQASPVQPLFSPISISVLDLTHLQVRTSSGVKLGEGPEGAEGMAEPLWKCNCGWGFFPSLPAWTTVPLKTI